MTDHLPFQAILKEHGEHVIHKFPAHEECNIDDADQRVYLDSLEVTQMVEAGKARYCEHEWAEQTDEADV